MKKTAAWILAVTLVLFLTACGGKNASATSSQGAGSSQPTEDVSTQENNKPDNGSLIVAADGLESMGEATEMLRGGTN